MAKTEDDANALRLLVIFLRFYADLKQSELGEATGLGQALISRYESGKQDLPEGSVRRIAAATGLPWPVVRDLGRCFSAVIRRTTRRWEGEGLDAGLLDAVLESARMAVFPYLVEELTAEPARPSREAERSEADVIWKNLEALPPSRRRRLIELARGAYPDWALAERICEASLRTADGDPGEALELTDLALAIAGQIAGEEEGWRSRVEGYCWGHVAHARRAANDLTGAEEASVRARDLWQAGGAADPELLPESRLLALAGTAF